jgi:hypothetical protein
MSTSEPFVLTERDFSVSPVWAYIDAPGSIDEQTLMGPVDVAAPIPDDVGLLMVASTFTTPKGNTLAGYITGVTPEGLPPYSVTLFAQGQDFTFNINSGEEDLRREWLKLKAAAGFGSDPIFPLRYRANVAFALQEPITGTFPEGVAED